MELFRICYTIFFLVRSISLIPRFDYLFFVQKNFSNSRQKEILLTKRLLMPPNTPLFSKYFYEYAFCKSKYVFLELPFKIEKIHYSVLQLDVKDIYCSNESVFSINYLCIQILGDIFFFIKKIEKDNYKQKLEINFLYFDRNNRKYSIRRN